ncbi:mitochondrial carrier [Wallemia mellicola CBS 633.66]|uniref:Mitochondrial carrier n=1 Tax=Wallemia mellicola (strain ATCC MYA-4683 / CBS 633.66) TaxID=671144 RepID=I4Y904_WALMC|nr:mitochondrial carrier [Wallemia mellicola CBS 633.66]EIM20446.1 mitochondrial carrier [Wallemia mellicola CBS 633.66]|eukprot:XP_006959472.1 mitochondrial carrier [Wallemia mellicola CBS 633.66]
MSSTSDQGSELRSFFAGIGSGLTKMVVGHPFDTIKTRLQCSPPGVFKGPIDCLRQTLLKENILALYKGGLAPAISWGCSDALLMGSLHNYRILILENKLKFFTEPMPGSSDKTRLSLAGQALAGMGAGWTNGVVAHPAELVKVRLQNQMERNKSERKYSGPWPIAKEVYQQHGIRGLYRGYAATLLFRSNMAVLFSSFELCMRGFKKYEVNVSVGTASFISGGIGATFFWICALPFDNVKNRLLFDDLNKPQLKGVIDTATKIYKTGGLRNFFKGFTTVFVRAFPTNAAALGTWTYIMHAFAS